MYKVRKLNFALNVRKRKQTGKYFLKLLHVYIFIRKSKSEIMKRKTKQQNYEQYGTQERYNHTTINLLFVVRCYKVLSRCRTRCRQKAYLLT